MDVTGHRSEEQMRRDYFKSKIYTNPKILTVTNWTTYAWSTRNGHLLMISGHERRCKCSSTSMDSYRGCPRQLSKFMVKSWITFVQSIFIKNITYLQRRSQCYPVWAPGVALTPCTLNSMWLYNWIGWTSREVMRQNQSYGTKTDEHGRSNVHPDQHCDYAQPTKRISNIVTNSCERI